MKNKRKKDMEKMMKDEKAMPPFMKKKDEKAMPPKGKKPKKY